MLLGATEGRGLTPVREMAKRSRAGSAGRKGRSKVEPEGSAVAVAPAEPEVSPAVIAEAAREMVLETQPETTLEPQIDVSPAESVGSIARDATVVNDSVMGEPVYNPRHVPVEIAIEIVGGDLLESDEVLIAAGLYEGLPPMGVARQLDIRLNSMISWAIEQRIIAPRLGELAYVPILHEQIKSRGILMAGLGEPGRLDRDDYRLVITNLVGATLCLGFDRIGLVLAGSSHRGLPLDLAAEGLVKGATDACRRALGSSWSVGGKVVPSRITIALKERNAERFDQLMKIFDRLNSPYNLPEKVTLTLTYGDRPPPVCIIAEPDGATRADLMPNTPVTRITVASSRSVASTIGAESQEDVDLILQYSAMTNTAAVPIRERVLKSYFANRLPERVITATTARDRESYGRLLGGYFLPEDFLRLLDEPDPDPLTLVLDHDTANYPWEMAAMKGYRGIAYFGPDLMLTRQFRSLISAAPGLAPNRNSQLKILIIADPAPHMPLEGAREEGRVVVRAFALAGMAWGRSISLDLTIRIEPIAAEKSMQKAQKAALERWAGEALADSGVHWDIAACDPLEILALLMNEHYDVIHFAGHGVFDVRTGRKGWIFDKGCLLSADEILKTRQVPRLVFANACHTSRFGDVNSPEAEALPEQVGLAEAFFARGVCNYIGAGWKIDDVLAKKFATTFYLESLGVRLADTSQVSVRTEGKAPPSTLGEALAAARRSVFPESDYLTAVAASTWGAYQHYGQMNDKLLSFTNEDGARANAARARGE